MTELPLQISIGHPLRGAWREVFRSIAYSPHCPVCGSGELRVDYAVETDDSEVGTCLERCMSCGSYARHDCADVPLDAPQVPHSTLDGYPTSDALATAAGRVVVPSIDYSPDLLNPALDRLNRLDDELTTEELGLLRDELASGYTAEMQMREYEGLVTGPDKVRVEVVVMARVVAEAMDAIRRHFEGPARIVVWNALDPDDALVG